MPFTLMKQFQLTIALWVMVSFFSLMMAQTRQEPYPMIPLAVSCDTGMIVIHGLLELGFPNTEGIFGGENDNRFACWEKEYEHRALHFFGLPPAPSEGLNGDQLWNKAYRARGEMILRYLAAAAKEYLDVREWGMACWSYLAFAEKRIDRKETKQAKRVLEEIETMASRVPIDEESRLEIVGYVQILYGTIDNLEGDYRKAIARTQTVLDQELSKPTNSNNDSFYIASYYQSLGSYHFNLGDLEQSASCFVTADMFDGPSEVPSPETNYKLGSIALLQNKSEKARDYLDKCLDRIKRRGGKQRLEIKALIGKSVSWQIEGEYGKALEFSKQATEVTSSEGKYLAWSSLGACYLRLYQPDLALAMLDSASVAYLSSKQAMQESQGFLSDLHRITGEAHLLAGEPVLALRFFQRALVENHQYFTDSLNLINNPDFAGVKDPIDFIKALRGKAKAWAQSEGNGEQWTSSLATYELAMEWVDSLRSDYTSETAQLGWSETFKSTFEGAIEVAFKLYAKTQDVVYLEKAFQFSEKSKNALLLERLKGGQGKSYAGIPDTILAREKALLVDLAHYTKALRAAENDRDSSRIELYRPYLAQTRINLASHQEKMEREYPKYRQLKEEITTPAPQRVRRELLDGQTAFLSYFVGKDSTYVLVLTQDTEAFVALGGSTKLKLLVNNFLKQLKNVDGFREQMKASKETFLSSGTKLYDAVLKAPLATLPKGVDRLIIAGDGNLTGVPLSALPRTEMESLAGSFRELPYLLHDYKIQYAFSAALQLEALQKSHKRSAKLECLGLAPNYETSQEQSMSTSPNRAVALAGTAREVEGIFRHVSGEYDTSSSATKELFLKRAGDFKILHLAMHGLADPEAPDLNHLTFADEDGKGDNLLYHHEIANMDLPARLVVLSACETGVGKHEVGEGVFSLARSFSYAGIPSVVMSLWSADDASTSELMPAFYEQLAAGEEQDVALQQAKLTFLENANQEQLHPYFWATFVGIGDTNSVIRNGWSWWWLLSVVVVGVGIWWRLSRSA